MFLLSSAALALALYAIEGTVSWFVVAGALIVLATLARDTGAIWSTLVCGPVVMMLIVVDVRRYGVRSALVRALLFAVATLPAALLFGRHWAFFRGYYMTANQWQLRQPLGTAASHMLNDLFLFVGPAAALVVIVLIVYAMWLARADTWEIADVAVVYWPVSIGLFLFANGYAASDVTKEIMYVAPGVVCAAVTLNGGLDIRSRRLATAVVSALAVCVVVAGSAAVAALQQGADADADGCQPACITACLGRRFGVDPPTRLVAQLLLVRLGNAGRGIDRVRRTLPAEREPVVLQPQELLGFSFSRHGHHADPSIRYPPDGGTCRRRSRPEAPGRKAGRHGRIQFHDCIVGRRSRAVEPAMATLPRRADSRRPAGRVCQPSTRPRESGFIELGAPLRQNQSSRKN